MSRTDLIMGNFVQPYCRFMRMSDRSLHGQIGHLGESDLPSALMCRLAVSGHHFFLGGGPGSNEDVVIICHVHHSGFQVAGNFSPLLRSLGMLGPKEIIESLNLGCGYIDFRPLEVSA